MHELSSGELHSLLCTNNEIIVRYFSFIHFKFVIFPTVSIFFIFFSVCKCCIWQNKYCIVLYYCIVGQSKDRRRATSDPATPRVTTKFPPLQNGPYPNYIGQGQNLEVQSLPQEVTPGKVHILCLLECKIAILLFSKFNRQKTGLLVHPIAHFTVNFSHLHYNVIQRGCEAISG